MATFCVQNAGFIAMSLLKDSEGLIEYSECGRLYIRILLKHKKFAQNLVLLFLDRAVKMDKNIQHLLSFNGNQ
ncbi:hypothetical protein KUTeg_020427 [Tegillarca granosa]|uniref:Uncharacterized protein n=1 Tax=Tegillarca granosa TaxID=220873 RepID=A0ABQ9EDB3_TEGGR|nr:hypothetical protein KUTeg_020427 [Tegillarca granosa]